MKKIGTIFVAGLFCVALFAGGAQAAPMGWLAFRSNQDGDSDIWAVRTDGTGLTQLVNKPGDQAFAQWSPDSHKIAYASVYDAQIWVYDWFTGTETKVYDAADHGGAYAVQGLAWSPDGSQIAFREDTTYNNPIIKMIDVATGSPVDNGIVSGGVVPVQAGFVSYPSFSPDGSELIYDRRSSGASYSHDLWTVDLTTGANTQLTFGANSKATTRHSSDWTPSDLAVFTYGHNIATIDPNTGSITFLTTDASYPSIVYDNPSWSPDVSGIAYNLSASGTRDLWIMNPDGSNAYRVMSTPYVEEDADWGIPVPEPGTLALGGMGLGGAMLIRRKRKRA